jgi:hypothetical protein
MRFKQWLEDTTLMHGGIYQPGDDDNTNMGCQSKWFGPPNKKGEETPFWKKFGFDKTPPWAMKSNGSDINTKRRGLMTNPQYYL